MGNGVCYQDGSLWVSDSLFSECKENSGDLHTAAEENKSRLPETISNPFPSLNARLYSSTESGPQKLFYWMKESIQCLIRKTTELLYVRYCLKGRQDVFKINRLLF